MENFINHLEIRNFKSIRELTLNGFKRINLFIGRPNVGKSNILEAISLFSLPYLWEGSKILTDIIRLENHRELFYDGDMSKGAAIGYKSACGEQQECQISFVRETGGLGIRTFERVVRETHSSTVNRKFFSIDLKFRLKDVSIERYNSKKDFIKKYSFRISEQSKGTKHTFLQPPSGNNLLHVLEVMPELKEIYTQ